MSAPLSPPPPERGRVQRALSAHSALGLLVAAALYILGLTGALSVFHDEWQRAEQPDAPEMTHLAPQAAQRAVAAGLAAERAAARPTTHLYLHLPTAELPRATVSTDHGGTHVDAAGHPAGAEEAEWSDFLLALHDTLTLPSLLGLSVVGALGAMLLALTLTGVLAHPRIFRDAFRLRARDRSGIGLADWHNRLSVWTLPFTLAVALTGASIGLGSITAYAVAQGWYGGDVEAAYAPLFGAEGQADARPAPVPDIAAALRTMQARFPNITPTYVILHEPMTVGQQVQVLGDHRHRLIYGENYVFDAAGRFLGTTGLADGAVGQQVVASSYKLHFGNFGGLPVKIAYALLGLGLCVIIATGPYLWLGKRERRGRAAPGLRAAWGGVVWGTPLVLAALFAARMLVGHAVPFTALFWGALVPIVALAARQGRRRALRLEQRI